MTVLEAAMQDKPEGTALVHVSATLLEQLINDAKLNHDLISCGYQLSEHLGEMDGLVMSQEILEAFDESLLNVTQSKNWGELSAFVAKLRHADMNISTEIHELTE